MSALYDWHDTSAAGLRVSVWVNNSNVGGGSAGRGGSAQGPPDVQRWSQPVNLAGALAGVCWSSRHGMGRLP